MTSFLNSELRCWYTSCFARTSQSDQYGWLWWCHYGLDPLAATHCEAIRNTQCPLTPLQTHSSSDRKQYKVQNFAPKKLTAATFKGGVQEIMRGWYYEKKEVWNPLFGTSATRGKWCKMPSDWLQSVSYTAWCKMLSDWLQSVCYTAWCKMPSDWLQSVCYTAWCKMPSDWLQSVCYTDWNNLCSNPFTSAGYTCKNWKQCHTMHLVVKLHHHSTPMG